MALRNGRSRGDQGGRRPFVFPSLKVDGELWTEEVVIPNRGQNVMDAQLEAGQVIRQRRAAIAAANAAAMEATVPSSEDSPESTVPSSGDSHPNSGSSLVDVSQVLSPQRVDSVIREWLAAHLPSTEQLFSASASLVGLQGIDQRVRDLVASFQEGLDSYRAAFTSWFEGVQQNWAGLVATGEATLQQWQDAIAQIGPWKADLEQRLFAAIADKVGPQGKVGPEGMAGTATTVVDRLPKGKGPDFLFPYIGRNAIVGDIAIDASTDMRYAWRWTGQAWERGPAMTSLQVRDVKISSLDASTKTYPTVSAATASGGGGTVGTPIMAATVAKNSAITIGDTSRFVVGGYDSLTSGIVLLEVIALDGTAAGHRSSLAAGFQFLAGGSDTFRFTEFSSLGDLFNGPSPLADVTFSGQLAAATVPAVIGASAPAGTKPASYLFVTITSRDPATTKYLLRGDILWNMDPATTAIPNTQLPPKQPAWNVV